MALGIKGGKYNFVIFIYFIDEYYDDFGHGDFPFSNDDGNDFMDFDEERYEG